MRHYIEERALELGSFIIENRTTVRAAAQNFGISKSTVHKDVTERLAKLDPLMAGQVKRILDENKAERHIRGGEATRMKYGREGRKVG
ncbi:MAG TPA: sporulation transcriptional regulator SpoIIID [Thermoclostridium sp.]|jgi:putative DeoR family transcriptional regulator (stage III sporulation protein D)|nr:sporulation transcriptional regulator SpoIIID [Bacillota bacterium]NLI37975.1 sporulation transcriptional regulator SpoIIID [Clostridiaceae bacterium]NLW03597.1 sporulation transcriptional regulator SpoIIID [Clostridiaceae bacterium]HOQ76602.1 sporulation transcriptional regulator SpoIIID [Thermoclostridium sp.]HPU45897.1 sporulation transcriptional regulator SpoIIID [Thermoclostridium sp.]